MIIFISLLFDKNNKHVPMIWEVLNIDADEAINHSSMTYSRPTRR